VRTYLLVVSHKVALSWIVCSSATAFPKRKRAEVDLLADGDRLILTTTRRCFGNPARDHTRVSGVAYLTSSVYDIDEPLDLLGKTFDRKCDLRLDVLARYREGAELGPLINDLSSFEDKTYWSLRMRSPLVAITHRDGDRLALELEPHAAPLAEAVLTYKPSPAASH